MVPIIGVSSHIENHQKLTLSYHYVEAITAAGGIPIVLPNLADRQAVRQIVKQIDGLLLSGGADLDPTRFGEEPHPHLGEVMPTRDMFELELVRQYLATQKPLLAICRGCQVLNVALAGDLYQDIYAQISTPLLQHRQHAPRSHASHYVEVEPNSLLAQIVGEERFKVNSFHHQAVRHVPSPLVVSARSSDGIMEAIESRMHPFVLGVQWHPEAMAVAGDQPSIKLFQAFIDACRPSC